MAPAAAASPVYFATVEADEPGTIQYACGVLATAVNSGLGGLTFCAARIAIEVGLTKKGIPASGLASSTRRTAGAGPTCVGFANRATPAISARMVVTRRAAAENITSEKLASRNSGRDLPLVFCLEAMVRLPRVGEKFPGLHAEKTS